MAMRYIDLLEAKLGDYIALGMDTETAQKYLDAKVPPQRAAVYQKHDIYRNFNYVLSDEQTQKRHKREDRAYNKLLAVLPELANNTTPLTHDEACAVIANDDQMFNSIVMHVSGTPDWFEDSPQDAERMRGIINRIKSFRHPPLYRGECSVRFGGEHTRGFHSWTIARDTAGYFYKDCPRDTGELWLLMVPIKGIDLGRVGLWRGRLRHESHYLSNQGEWLVPDGYPHKVIDRW